MIHVDPRAFDAFRQRLDDIASRADDIRPVLRDVSEDLQLLIEEGFKTEGASYGKRWTPLARSYRQQRVKAGRGTRIMRLQGGKGGLLLKSFKGGSQSTNAISSDSVTVGTRLGIAPMQHRGGSRTVTYSKGAKRRFKIPARPMLPPARKLRERYGPALSDFIVNGKRGGGL